MAIMFAVNQQTSGTDAGGPLRSRFPLRRRLVQTLVVTPLLALVVMVGGFFWFALNVASEETAFADMADGIVVLTGGASRINDAVELHGVQAAASGSSSPASRRPPTPPTSPVCSPSASTGSAAVSILDYSAVNTIGNAVETRRWALGHGFRSLVVVTSSYHMPRAMLELVHRLPGVTLIPFSVVTEQHRTEPWWSNAASAKILVSEYLKYIVAAARIGFDQPSGPTETANRRRARI